MNKRNVIRVILPILIVAEICFLFLTFKSFSNRNIDEIKETYKVDKKMFAMYTENENGTYSEYTSSNYFPSDGYRIDLEKSNCVDNKGNKVEGILTGVGNKITVSSNKTAFCYLYFQKSTNLYELCKDSNNIDECITNNSSKIKYIHDIWDSTLEDDGYRYVGTNPDNYICFGTESQEDCMNDTDKYMYRIIGIFEDEEGKQHLKLIKKEVLNTSYKWNAVYNTDVAWDASDLYKGINGDYFLNNASYSYMQDSSWNSLIDTWNYTATNTKTYENYNSTNGTPYGPYYYYSTGQSLYLHELNRSGKSNETCYYNSSTTADCTVGTWTSVPAKIGLMYASDYALSLGEVALTYTSSNYSTMKTGWMHLSNNDSATLSTTAVAPPSSNEWTMSRYGAYSDGYYRAWSVYSHGDVSTAVVNNAFSVRPVFYLTSDSVLSGGDGTSDNPYLIAPPIGGYLMNNPTTGLTTSETEGGLYRYQGTTANNYICFGTNDKNTCINNADKYMYRIIGINENKQLKLLKDQPLKDYYQWHSDNAQNINWPNSNLYQAINGDGFLKNETYIQNGWENKISYYDWKYGRIPGYDVSALEVYTTENSWSETVNAKIGLKYLYDHYYGIKGGNNCSYASDVSETCKSAWLQSNDGEWTMSSFGYHGGFGYYVAHFINWNGAVGVINVAANALVRPVFYLNNDISYIGGEGTENNPFIIS